MKMTGFDPVTGFFAWTEQTSDANGNPYDKPDGLFGTVAGVAGATVTWNPAVEENGRNITVFPWFDYGRRVVQTDTVGGVFYFSDRQSDIGIPQSIPLASGTLSTALGPGGITVATVTLSQAGLYLFSASLETAIGNATGSAITFNPSAWNLVVTAGGATIFGPGNATPAGGLANGFSAYFDHNPVWFVTVTTSPATIQVNYGTAVQASAGAAEVIAPGGVLLALLLRPPIS